MTCSQRAILVSIILLLAVADLYAQKRETGFFNRTDGGCDWNAERPACNAVASAASNLSVLRSLGAFSCFALMQAGTPAFRSHPPSEQDFHAVDGTLTVEELRKMFAALCSTLSCRA